MHTKCPPAPRKPGLLSCWRSAHVLLAGVAPCVCMVGSVLLLIVESAVCGAKRTACCLEFPDRNDQGSAAPFRQAAAFLVTHGTHSCWHSGVDTPASWSCELCPVHHATAAVKPRAGGLNTQRHVQTRGGEFPKQFLFLLPTLRS